MHIEDTLRIQIARVHFQVITENDDLSRSSTVIWDHLLLALFPTSRGDKQYLLYNSVDFVESSHFCGRFGNHGLQGSSFKSDLFAEMRLSASEKMHPHPILKKKMFKIPKETKPSIESVNDTL